MIRLPLRSFVSATLLLSTLISLSACQRARARELAPSLAAGQAAGMVPAETDAASKKENSARDPKGDPKNEPKNEIERWCKDLTREVNSFKWKIDPCLGMEWKVGGHSVEGRPLVYGEFGSGDAKNTTLILSAVHGDEITPVYLGLRLVRWLRENPEELKDVRVVVAPLVNPDGFFRRPRTRMNARGVDVNRNFDTRDWRAKALSSWKGRFKSDPRRFPGNAPGSEPETEFQVQLLRSVNPQKVLSIHSPLNFLDYDGPTHLSLAQFPRDYVRRCLQLRSQLKAISGGFFPGSLGNYAGRELGIPTLTLELPTTDPGKAEVYWLKFHQGVRTMIHYELPAGSALREKIPVPSEEVRKVSRTS